MSFPTTLFLSDDAVKTQSSAKKWPLGTRGITSDGRVFRYAYNGASALSAGNLVEAAAALNCELSTGQPLSTDQGTITSTWGGVTLMTTWDATSTYTKDMFADGYLVTAGSTGAPQMVRIKANTTSVGATASQKLEVTFKEDSRLATSITTAQEIALYRNPYYKTLVQNGAGAIIGVAPIAASASYYYWLQTWGLCPVVANIAVAQGIRVQGCATTSYSGVIGSDTTLGSTETLAPIGVMWNIGNGTAGETQIINLQISP
jgi:hypothetical protein